jgi:thiol-disulfide isomerase/thioredoxin
MKPFILLICFFPIYSGSFAQRTEAILSGKANAADHYIEYFSEDRGWVSPSADSIRIASDGSFLQSFMLKKPAMVYMRYAGAKRLQLWMRPGDSLHIDLSGAAPILTGSAEKFAAYFIEDQNIWSEIFAAYQKKYPGFEKEPNVFSDQYFSIQDSITSCRINFLEKHFSGLKNKSTREFISHQTASLLYSNLFYKLSFEGANIERFGFYQKKYNIHASHVYAFSDQIVFNDSKLIDNTAYRRFITILINTIVHKRIKETGQKFNRDLYVDLGFTAIDELTEKSASSVNLTAVFLDDIVNDLKRSKDLEVADNLYTKLALLDSNHRTYANLIKKKLDGIVTDTRFNTGKPASDFTFKNMENLLYRLKDFKGKKIYIDIGASWCAPCIEGIPAWNKLVDQHAGNERVAFLSLSIDDNEAAWKDFLKKHTVRGTQLYAGNGGFKSNFATDYKISAIPHFILIDEAGRFIKYNAPRPDSKEILHLLNPAR